MAKLTLNRSLALDSEGQITLERKGNRLHAWVHYPSGDIEHFNPFSFGAAFYVQTLELETLTPLARFLDSGAFRPEPYFPNFPVEQQCEVMKFFMREEYATQINEEIFPILCSLYEQLFPAYWRYAVTSHSRILYDGFYGRFMSESYIDFQSAGTYRELIEEVFGEARKDTLRESTEIDAMGLSLAYVYRGLLPLEVMLQELTATEGHFAEFPLNRELYKPLNRLSSTVRRRLFSDLMVDYELDSSQVEDALDLLEHLPESRMKRLKGVTSWKDLHERLMKHADSIEGSAMVNLPEKLYELEEPIEGVEFKALIYAHDFLEAGSLLDICIGKAGYFRKAIRGESYCFVGIHGGSLRYALEVKQVAERWRVIQLRGSKNELMDNHDLFVKLIEDRLNEGELA